MQVKSFLVVIPFFLLLQVYTALAESHVQCWPLLPGLGHRLDAAPGSFKFGSEELPIPAAADCLHIISNLPSSLAMNPFKQAAYGRLAVEYGRLVSHRFDLPALLVHQTCAIGISSAFYDSEKMYGRQLTRQETAFYFWNSFKSSAQKVVHTCLTEPAGHYGGFEHMEGADAGVTEKRLAKSFIMISVLPAGYPEPGNLGHIYQV